MTQKSANIIAGLVILGLATGYYLVQYRKSGSTTFQLAVASATSEAVNQPMAEKTPGMAGPVPSGDSLSLITGESASQTTTPAEGELDRPEGMDWFYKRFGSSTWFAEGTFNVKSFTPQEYEALIAAALQGNESATIALRLSILKYLKENPEDDGFKTLKERLYSEEFLKRVPRFEYLAEMLPDEILDNRELASSILSSDNNGYNLKFFSVRLRADKELVAMAMAHAQYAPYVLPFISDPLRSDKQFIQGILEKEPAALHWVADEFKDDKGLVLAALKRTPAAYSAASERLQNDPEILPLIRSFLLSGGRRYIEKLPERLLADKQVVMLAVERNCSILQSVSLEFRDDEEIIKKATEHNQHCLKYASNRLQEKLKQR